MGPDSGGESSTGGTGMICNEGKSVVSLSSQSWGCSRMQDGITVKQPLLIPRVGALKNWTVFRRSPVFPFPALSVIM
jgi:hypothetical protein